MRSFAAMSMIALLWSLTPARAGLRVCNPTIAPVRLALVWVNRADAKTTSVPFTTQGWWSTAPNQCENIDIDGVLLYYHLEGEYELLGKRSPSSFPVLISGQSKYPKYNVLLWSMFRHYSGSGPMPNGFELPFAKFSAFPLIGKGHWLLLTLQVGPLLTVTEICTATAEGGASLTMRCDQTAPPRR
jgi:hypothetical protein